MDGAICISIADNGVGIPPESLPHIFDRFYRVDKSRSGRQRGSGLGLALVRAMVEANEGEIRVTSAPEVGSTFTVKFPTCESKKAQDLR
jgi:signal transduction histidine kinase